MPKLGASHAGTLGIAFHFLAAQVRCSSKRGWLGILCKWGGGEGLARCIAHVRSIALGAERCRHGSVIVDALLQVHARGRGVRVLAD